MFQAKLRGWKRLAASLVLLPGLAAVGAEMFHLLGTSRAQERPAASAESAQVEAGKILMQQARTAYNKGDYAKAQELAEKVKMLNLGMPFWEDGPDNLLADVRKKTGGQTSDQVKATKEDPRTLVRRAREVLEAGNLDRAQDWARQAEANSRDISWGLFEDTPASVLKDVQKARSKRERSEADRLLTQARSLFERRASGEEARAANLDKSRSLALQAAQLHGPYNMWDLGDRPQSLIKDIDSARSKLKVIAHKSDPKGKDADPFETALNSKPSGKSKEPRLDPDAKLAGYNPVKLDGDGPNKGTFASKPNPVPKPLPANDMQGMVLPPEPLDKPAPSVGAPLLPPGSVAGLENPGPQGDLRKSQTVQLMQQAHACQVGHKYVEAHKLLVQAQQQNTPFGPEDETPEAALQSLMSEAQKHINNLCREAHELMVKKTAADVASAETKLSEAEAIAIGLGLDRWAIGEHRLTLRTIKGHASGSNGPTEAARLPDPNSHIPTAIVLPAEPMTTQVPVPAFVPPADPVATKPATIPPADPLVSQPPADPVATKPASLPPADPLVSQPPAFQPPADPVATKPSSIPPADPVVSQPPAFQPPADPVVAQPADQGLELLKQAHNEMSRQQLDNARKIAYQVLNGPYQCKKEAEAFLRTLDAEELSLKKVTALRSYEHGVAAYQQRNYEQALSIFKLIDPSLLPPQKRDAMNQLSVTAARAVEKPKGLVAAGDPDRAPEPATPGEKGGADSLLKQQEAMTELQFQKLRSEGLQVEASATTRFGKGETDAALADMNNFIAKVKSTNLDPSKVALLVRPIENRMDRLKVLKHQQDFLTKEAKDLRGFRTQMSQESLQKAQKKEEVARMMKDFSRLVQEGKYQEAGKLALMAREMDPDDPAITAAMHIAHTLRAKKEWTDVREEGDEYRRRIGNNNFKLGPDVDIDDPIRFNKDTFERMRNRQDLNGGISTLRPMTETERKIEATLSSRPISFNFKNTPLDEVISYMQTYSGINFDIETKALQNENIDPKTPITSTLNNLPLKHALGVVLDKVNLRYIVTHEVVRVTTQKGSLGAMQRRTLPVADLVIPVQNYNPSAVSNLETALEHSNSLTRPLLPGMAATPYTPTHGLGQQMGNPIGTSSPTPPGGRLLSAPAGSGNGVMISNASGTIEEALIRLITNSVKPQTWEAMGGAGRIEYFPIGMALVINQTPDVIEEVIRLLESLRQLQDLEIAIEVRMIALAESFYERIGLDFSMNVNTHSKEALVNLNNNTAFSNINNAANAGAKVIGIQGVGVPTPDLNLPITATSFGQAIPPFGNYPNAPGLDGGLSLGLAFLSDIQVQMFLEAAQGDRRTNVMQAPKLTMFNGQSANIRIQDQQFFMTSISVTSVNGQLVFTPQNQPFPLGVTMFMQPVVSGDRRFVRLNIQQTMTNLASATVPLFPITTIVTPVFEGGAQGQPVPFTQYVQQPTFTTITVQTTVVVPDGGTVLMGGLKTLSEGRNEFGPPVLSKIPYINRLFRNVGYGREAQSLMIMVTPRIIINREEQEIQTGVREADAAGLEGP